MIKIKLLYLVWILAVIFIVLFSNRKHVENHQFFGIAESNEVIINFENPVEIKNIYVVPGQKVNKGTLLLELDQSELTLDLNEIKHQLSEFKLQRKIEKNQILTQIKELKAQKFAKTNEINSEIIQLQSQHALNKRLTADLKSIMQKGSQLKETEKKSISSPIQLKITSLNEKLKFDIEQIDIKIKSLKKILYSDKNTLTVKIDSLKKETELLTTAKDKLLIYSENNGIIGSVNFKRGEKVTPFASILTIYTHSPSYVKGFVHENVYNRISVNEQVIVSSLTDNTVSDGIVVGVGSRIIEFPERLRKRPEIKIWGREIQMKITENSDFLLGEKVIIQPKTKESSGIVIWENFKQILLNMYSKASFISSFFI
jgi:HlyD family secretion protein